MVIYRIARKGGSPGARTYTLRQERSEQGVGGMTGGGATYKSSEDWPVGTLLEGDVGAGNEPKNLKPVKKG